MRIVANSRCRQMGVYHTIFGQMVEKHTIICVLAYDVIARKKLGKQSRNKGTILVAVAKQGVRSAPKRKNNWFNCKA